MRCAAGIAPEDLLNLEAHADGAALRDVFIFFINGAKESWPATAVILLARLWLRSASATQVIP